MSERVKWIKYVVTSAATKYTNDLMWFQIQPPGIFFNHRQQHFQIVTFSFICVMPKEACVSPYVILAQQYINHKNICVWNSMMELCVRTELIIQIHTPNHQRQTRKIIIITIKKTEI